MKDNPQITQRELSKILNITIDGVKYHIRNLSKKASSDVKGQTEQEYGR